MLGLTTASQLPSSYVPAAANDTTYNGSQDIWIGKFNTINGLSWGTYVGGAQADTLNDIEVFSDGRVAFAGWGNSTLSGIETRGAAASSAVTTNPDGYIGVLTSNGQTFNYFDEIGGANWDRLMDVEIVGTKLYWTGSVGDGFPVSTSGVYDNTFNGRIDAVVGVVSDTGGVSTYKATFYGSSGQDLGN